jgi:hypothetical protein
MKLIKENIKYSKANRFGSAKNQMFSKEILKDYLIKELNNSPNKMEPT